ncbi:MAG TPA: hypothetical protein VGR81_01890 [Candidatus Acidoferrales bacterium]|nr:hypothetical protein [Candidatus Acidoferrales bacterium]
MNTKLQFGLLALMALSALAAISVSILIARRQDLAVAARRAFLLSNVALIFCLASAIAGVSVYRASHLWGNILLGAAVAFLILKFILVRQFAHLIRQGQPKNRPGQVLRSAGKS